METDDWIGIKEAAEILGVHPNTIRHRIKTGVYPTHKVLTPNGEAYMLPRSILEEESTTPSNGVVPSMAPTIRDVIVSSVNEAITPLVQEREQLVRELEQVKWENRSYQKMQAQFCDLVAATSRRRGRLYHLRCLLRGDPDG